MKLHNISILQWYLSIATVFVPINLLHQYLLFRKDKKGLEKPYTKVRFSGDDVHFAPAVKNLLGFALFWPFTLLLGYLGFIFMTLLFGLAELVPYRSMRSHKS